MPTAASASRMVNRESFDDTMIAAESVHFYLGADCERGKRGDPCYTIVGANGKERPITLADIRRNPQWQAVPSVTLILKCAAAPGLENWKMEKMLHASLTLPRISGETEDAFAKRVIKDSQEQGEKARERGNVLHAAIEQWIRNTATEYPPSVDPAWKEHVRQVYDTCFQYGIDLLVGGSTEHSFASPLGYGGKIDFHNHEPLVIDFKTKDCIDDSKQLAWDNHCQQLAAYGFGLGFKKFRALNVFIGCDDKQVRVFEHSWEDLQRGFAAFRCLLGYWQLTKRFGPHAK